MSNDRDIQRVKRKVNKHNRDRDNYLNKKSDAMERDKIFTPCKASKRIKKDKLLKHNKGENGWPGGRNNYAIDRDQILYNINFSKLAKKTQVFIGQKNVLFRNRLMHTMEVQQISHSIAEHYGLNVDLVDAIAYGHDIGHTPFGHPGEAALNFCVYEYYLRNFCKLGIPRDEILPSEYKNVTNSDNKSRDYGIFLLIESALKYNNECLPSKNDLTKIIGKDKLSILIDIDVINISSNGCKFNPPRNWQISNEPKTWIKDQFWLEDDEINFFRHNAHSLWVLLCDGSRPHADITAQTAYGILSHSWKGMYDSFDLIGNDMNFSLTNKYETPEAFVVRMADDICFTNSDILDCKNSELIKWNEFSSEEQNDIWGLTSHIPGDDFPSGSEILSNLENIYNFKKPFDIDDRNHKNNINLTIKNAMDKVRNGIVRKKIYPLLAERQRTARKIIRDLFWYYSVNINPKRHVDDMARKKFKKYNSEYYRLNNKIKPLKKAVDYIANMTDDEAINTHKALFAPEQTDWVKYFIEERNQ